LTQEQAEDLHTEGVNSPGYLIRAPISGNIAECPINKNIWPFLKESKGIIKPSQIEVPLRMVLDNYERLVLGNWHTIVANDSRTSITGAFQMSSSIAKGTVMKSLNRQQAILDDFERQIHRPMEQVDEGKLLLMQMDFTAAYTASDCLYKLIVSENQQG
jgi:hypothetical protein